LYPLDEKTIDIELDAGGYQVKHRLARPTKTQLVERESRVKNEEITLDESQVETVYDDDGANVKLYDECIREVAGYDLGDGSLDWRPVDEQIRTLMPSEHKIKAVAAMYLCQAHIDKAATNGHVEGFRLLGAMETRIALTIGDRAAPAYEIVHILRRPNESEWTAYRRGIQRTIQVRGAQLPRYKTSTNLAVACAFYDALVTGIEGAILNGETYSPANRDAFLAAVDPIHKRVVSRAYAEHWAADLSD
jgi:hypothetical protein